MHPAGKLKPKRISKAQSLLSQLQMARVRLARAEYQLKTAKEQVRVTKRRRREAKEAVKRAKRQARQAKDEIAESRLLLSVIEAKLFKSQTSAEAKKKKATSSRKAETPPGR